MFTVYILQSERNGRYYIGQTEDLINRINRHNSGQVVATRNKGPWVIVHSECFETRKEAMNRELEIKSKKSRKYIEKLIADGGTGRHVPT